MSACGGSTATVSIEDATYTVTFTATWSAETHPYEFPAGAHWSGLIGASHSSGVTFWAIGELASAGIQQMAETGVAVAFARGELVSLLRGIIAKGPTGPNAPFPNADISLEGTLEDLLVDGAAADLEDNFRAHLARHRGRDRAAGRTLEGPHRRNLAVRHGPKNMEAALCSTGEQKALLTGLVLAHTQLVGDVSGMTPILLLDEIAAHLDENRRAALFDLIDTIGCQAWMTGTDQPMFKSLGDRARFFQVASGKVEEAG